MFQLLCCVWRLQYNPKLSSNTKIIDNSMESYQILERPFFFVFICRFVSRKFLRIVFLIIGSRTMAADKTIVTIILDAFCRYWWESAKGLTSTRVQWIWKLRRSIKDIGQLDFIKLEWSIVREDITGDIGQLDFIGDIGLE